MSVLLRLLFVESSGEAIEPTLRLLKEAGYEPAHERIDTLSSMKAALLARRFDMVIADYVLPGFNVLDALEHLNRLDPDVPLIVVSSEVGKAVAVEIMKHGARDFISRDDLTRLVPAIQRELLQAEVRRERRNALDALRACEDRYRELVDNANDMIYVHDLDGNFTSMNKAGELIFGYSRQEFMQMNTSQIFSPQQCEHGRKMIELKLNGKPETSYEIETTTKDGRKVTLEMSTRLTYQDGKPSGVIGIGRDITLRKQLEEQLRQSQKMEAVGQLAGGVAQDFNNLLTAMTGYSELLLAALKPQDPLRRDVEEIKKAADRASALTRQLLAFSRRQVLAPQVLDLNQIVANMEKMLRRLIGENIKLVTIPSLGLGRVKTDPGQIEQVILNLCINARDAMPQGGTLTLETANVTLDGSYVRSHAMVQPGPYIKLVVSDTGCGMNEEVQAHLFEPFFTTKETGRGTGLGLSTVYGIVHQSGGHIHVYSEPGKGAAFTIYLPKAEEKAELEKTAELLTHSPIGSETILLAEDEEVVRNLVRTVLLRNGYTVLEARNGEDALLVSARNPGVIHLMLTDTVMPGMSGRELADKLAPTRPEMKVLYMSGYTRDSIIQHGVLEPGTAFIQKPFLPDALVRKVREVLRSKLPPT